jgi:hypothetical protein
MATSTPPAPVEAPETGARRRRVLVAGTALLVLVLVVAGTAWVVGYQRAQAQAQADLDEALAAYEPVALELSQWISATHEAIGSSEETAQQHVRADAGAVLAQAETLDTAPPEDGPLRERVAAVRELHERVLAEIEVVTAANVAVMTSAYEGTIEIDIASYHERMAVLVPAIDAGEQAYAAGGGDEAARAALRSALDAGIAVRDHPVEMTDQYLLADLTLQMDPARVEIEAATAALAG